LEWRRWKVSSIEREDLDKIEPPQKAYGGYLEQADLKTMAADSNPINPMVGIGIVGTVSVLSIGKYIYSTQ
jgi:hypothetical protein